MSAMYIMLYHVISCYRSIFAMVGPNLPSAEPDGCSVGAHEPPTKWLTVGCGGTWIRAEIDIFGLDHLDFTNKPWI